MLRQVGGDTLENGSRACLFVIYFVLLFCFIFTHEGNERAEIIPKLCIG